MMKYLESYNIFEARADFYNTSLYYYKQMKPDLDDLIGHFHDIGIQSRIETYHDETLYEIYVILTKNRTENYTGGSLEVIQKFISWYEVKDNIHQLISFMSEKHKEIVFTECQLNYITEWKSSDRDITLRNLDEIDKFEGSNKILQIDLTFSRENNDDE